MSKTISSEKTNRTSVGKVIVRIFLPGLILLLGCAIFSSVRFASDDTMRYQSGLRNGIGPNKLDSKQLQTILDNLRQKSGFLEMSFDSASFLRLGDRSKFEGGSQTARALISAAADFRNVIDLEAHNYSTKVAFARLAAPATYQNRLTNEQINVYPIQIDFTDFKKVRGDKKVIDAFDIGFVLLHELGHAVLGLRDPATEQDGPGECEGYVNRIRRELGLPERQNYVAHVYSTLGTPMQRTLNAELLFTHSADPRRYLLSWEASAVGPVREPQPGASNKTNKTASASVNGQ